MPIKKPKIGQRVVFAKDKFGERPGERARDVVGTQKGDSYSYIVEKYWVIDEIQENGKLLLRTRRGKLHLIDQEHPGLRLPTWWEKLFLSGRFPPKQSEVPPGESTR